MLIITRDPIMYTPLGWSVKSISVGDSFMILWNMLAPNELKNVSSESSEEEDT
jgi:hypothetical protein